MVVHGMETDEPSIVSAEMDEEGHINMDLTKKNLSKANFAKKKSIKTVLSKSTKADPGKGNGSMNSLVSIRKEKNDRMDQGRNFLLLWLGTLILAGWLGDLCGLEYAGTFCFGVLFALSALLEFLLPELPAHYQDKYRRIIYLCLGICPLIALILPALRKGISGLCHDASLALAKRGINFFFSGTANVSVVSKSLAFLFLSLWILLFVKVFILEHLIPVRFIFLLLIIMLLVEMRAGNGECVVWMILSLFWFLLIYISSLEGAILVAVPLLVITILIGTVSGFSSSGGWKKLWTGFRYGQTRSVRSVLPEGQLAKAGSLNRGKETALIIDGDYVDTYYLKGYVGTVYRDNSWVSDDQTLRDLEAGILGGGEKEFLSWLHQKDDSGWNALADQAGTGSSRRLRIRNVGASRKYLYLPYELTTRPSQLERYNLGVYTTGESILARGLMGRKKYEIETEHCLAGEMTSHTAQNSASSHYYKAYEEYVNRTCLTLPKEVKKDLRRKLGGKSTEGVEDPLTVLRQVRKWIEETITYDENPGSVDQDKDFVQWFLDENPRGYDVHYATMAVMLFRYYGIPSRYVEGYLTNHNKEITQEDAHAWPEIYLSGYGWIPVEVMEDYQDKMPSYLESLKEDTVMEDRGGENLGQEEKKEREEKTETAPSGTKETGPAAKKGSSAETDDGRSGSETESEAVDVGFARRLLIVAGILLLLLIILIIMRVRVWHAHRSVIHSIHPEECVVGWYQYCMLLLYELETDSKEKKAMITDNRLVQWESRWRRHHPAVNMKILRQAGLLRQKSIYRAKGIDWQEANKVISFFEEESRYLYEKLGILGKIRVMFGMKPFINKI